MKHGRGITGLLVALPFGWTTSLTLFGQWRRALAYLALLVAIVLGSFVSAKILLLYFALLIGLYVDTYIAAARSTGRTYSLAAAGMLVVTILFMLGMRAYLIEAFKMPSSSMYPTLKIGDHVFINKLASIHRGDIAVFEYPCDPRRDYIKRIVALGGDTVEVRCSALYINGTRLPEQLVTANDSYEDYDDMEDRWLPRQVSRYRETLDGKTYETFHDTDRPERDVHPTGGDQRDFPRVGNPFPPSCQGQADAFASGSHPPAGKIVETKPEDPLHPCEPQLHYVVPEGYVFAMGDNRFNSNDSRFWGPVKASTIKGRAYLIWWSKDLSRLGGIP